MFPHLLLSLALLAGRVDCSSADESAEPSSLASDVPCERWLFMQSRKDTWPGWLLDSNRIEVYGWTEGSFTASSAAREQLPMGFNYRANQFLLQQNWLRVERTVNTTAASFGFRADTILPGSDYRFTLARGLFDRQLTANDGEPAIYGIDPVQFYAQAYFPSLGEGLELKVGRIFCQYGVEAIDAPSNQLLSHAYTFIYNPFTHTGVMGTLALTEAWSVQLGMMTGSDIFIDRAAEPTGMASVQWTSPDGRNAVLFSMIAGPGRFNEREQFNNPNIFDIVLTQQLSPRMTYTLDALFGYQTNIPDIGTATWFGVVNYLTYQVTPRLSGTARLEFFDDIHGNLTGFKGLYTALTAGLNFQPRRDIILRPEIRYDHNRESRPFENRHGLLTAAADVIVRW